MKIIGAFGLVVTASLALLQPAQGGSRGSGHSSFSAQHYYSVPAAHYWLAISLQVGGAACLGARMKVIDDAAGGERVWEFFIRLF